MNKGVSQWQSPVPFTTEAGFVFSSLTLAYKTWGALNATGTNAVVVCHALTGHAAADEWFPGIFEPQGFVSTHRPFVICINVPGSCYGSTGPLSINPQTGRVYGSSFPVLSIRDMVQAQRLLLDALGIREIQLVVGPSMGGMQALEWALLDPRVRRVIPISVGKAHHAWQIGFSEAQRQTIFLDPKWKGGDFDPADPPVQGLAAARMAGMMTYRSAVSFEQRFGRNLQPETEDRFQISSYLQHQGGKLTRRMDALTYVRLTQAMDTHDIGRDRDIVALAAGRRIDLLAVGIRSDILYPPEEQRELATLFPHGRYIEMDSDKGHDAFLIEFDTLNQIFSGFLGETGLAPF